uniref:Uncharacterized protein n=1 Tax=Melanopsichium pennsylvanicum 4 TaxID=1398559 RepID=A0A077QTB2_9BASI|nr:uncharacterized protein BN887_00388 [Melanopsichium pennsylvanicum 4]
MSSSQADSLSQSAKKRRNRRSRAGAGRTSLLSDLTQTTTSDTFSPSTPVNRFNISHNAHNSSPFSFRSTSQTSPHPHSVLNLTPSSPSVILFSGPSQRGFERVHDESFPQNLTLLKRIARSKFKVPTDQDVKMSYVNPDGVVCDLDDDADLRALVTHAAVSQKLRVDVRTTSAPDGSVPATGAIPLAHMNGTKEANASTPQYQQDMAHITSKILASATNQQVSAAQAHSDNSSLAPTVNGREYLTITPAQPKLSTEVVSATQATPTSAAIRWEDRESPASLVARLLPDLANNSTAALPAINKVSAKRKHASISPPPSTSSAPATESAASPVAPVTKKPRGKPPKKSLPISTTTTIADDVAMTQAPTETASADTGPAATQDSVAAPSSQATAAMNGTEQDPVETPKRRSSRPKKVVPPTRATSSFQQDTGTTSTINTTEAPSTSTTAAEIEAPISFQTTVEPAAASQPETSPAQVSDSVNTSSTSKPRGRRPKNTVQASMPSADATAEVSAESTKSPSAAAPPAKRGRITKASKAAAEPIELDGSSQEPPKTATPVKKTRATKASKAAEAKAAAAAAVNVETPPAIQNIDAAAEAPSQATGESASPAKRPRATKASKAAEAKAAAAANAIAAATAGVEDSAPIPKATQASAAAPGPSSQADTETSEPVSTPSKTPRDTKATKATEDPKAAADGEAANSSQVSVLDEISQPAVGGVAEQPGQSLANMAKKDAPPAKKPRLTKAAKKAEAQAKGAAATTAVTPQEPAEVWQAESNSTQPAPATALSEASKVIGRAPAAQSDTVIAPEPNTQDSTAASTTITGSKRTPAKPRASKAAAANTSGTDICLVCQATPDHAKENCRVWQGGSQAIIDLLGMIRKKARKTKKDKDSMRILQDWLGEQFSAGKDGEVAGADAGEIGKSTQEDSSQIVPDSNQGSTKSTQEMTQNTEPEGSVRAKTSAKPKAPTAAQKRAAAAAGKADATSPATVAAALPSVEPELPPPSGTEAAATTISSLSPVKTRATRKAAAISAKKSLPTVDGSSAKPTDGLEPRIALTPSSPAIVNEGQSQSDKSSQHDLPGLRAPSESSEAELATSPMFWKRGNAR